MEGSGFLVLDKPYSGGNEFASELFFLQTIQTILAEEVANAVHLSKLVDLKNFNEAVLDFLAFDARQRDTAEKLARAVTGHATPVGSGTPRGSLPGRLSPA